MNIKQQIKNLVEASKVTKKWTPGVDYVQYAGPYFDGSETEDAIEVLLEGWLGLSERGIRFETVFPKHFGKEYGVLTNSGSSANLLMVSALKSKRYANLPVGAKIATAAAGFPTTLNPIIQNGFEPVLVDIEYDTLNIDVQKLHDSLKANPDTRALIFAHVLGNSPNMNDIMYLVEKYNLILLEDCCDALGSKFEGKLLGSYGDMASCSFYPAHHISMGEGGFVACKNKEIETVIKSLREWGRSCYCSGKNSVCLKNGFCKKRFSAWIPELEGQIFDHKYVYDEIGYNLKPLELQAAMGLRQLEKLPIIIDKRKENYKRLHEIFSKYPKYFKIHESTIGCDVSWFAFPVSVLPNEKFTKYDVCSYLEDCKIQTRNYFAGNIMLQPAYRGLPYATDAKTKYPISTRCMTTTFFLGTSPIITEEQIAYIGEKVADFVAKHEA